MGQFVPHVINGLLLAAETWVRSQGISCGLYRGETGIGSWTIDSLETGVSKTQCHPRTRGNSDTAFKYNFLQNSLIADFTKILSAIL
jgi:hypothetical protein